jgi:hypothetical protein
MMSEIKACKCKHAAQDALHGAGQRVHNPNAKGALKCTVCGAGGEKKK